MPIALGSRIQQQGVVSGTGSIDLGAVAAGAAPFSRLATGSRVTYVVQTAGGAQWEVGIGTLDTASNPDRITRDIVLSNSSGTTSKISFPTSSVVDVFCDLIPEIEGWVPRGYIDGFRIDYSSLDAGGSTTQPVVINPGIARDDQDLMTIRLNSALAKSPFSSFSEAGQGARASGSASPSTDAPVYWFVIRKADGATNILSSSTLTPTLPSGFVAKRYIGASIAATTASLRGLIQNNDYFEYVSKPRMFLDSTTIGSVIQSFSAPVPDPATGVLLEVSVAKTSGPAAVLIGGEAGNVVGSNLDDPFASQAPPLTVMGRGSSTTTTAGAGAQVFRTIERGAPRQITVGAPNTQTRVKINCVGWIDPRGKDA